METFNFRHEADQTGTRMARSRSIQFGDGYSQDSNEPLNKTRREYQIECSGYTELTIAALDAFINLHGGGTAFFYTPSGESIGKFKIIQPVQTSKKMAGGAVRYFHTRSFKIQEAFRA
jgi:phage-related protein